MDKLAIVVPCYNEELSVERFYQEATAVFSGQAFDYELIFVDDGSSDNTLLKLGELAKADAKVKVLSFSRNFGQQAAIICGFRASTGDAVVEMDCDLQDPVDVVLEMVKRFEEGFEVDYFKSSNVDGGDEWNDRLIAKYEDVIPGLN